MPIRTVRPRSSTPRAWFAALLVGALALALAACSSDPAARPSSKSNDDHGPTSGAATPAKASAGCASGTAISPGESKVTIPVAGSERWYLQHIPPAAASGSKPQPVIFDLHGYLEGATIHATTSRLGAFGDVHGFVTITPQGSGEVAHWDFRAGSSDMSAFGAMLDNVEQTLCVDTNRVFVTGYSNGAFFASAIACAYSARVAAIAPVAGLLAIPGCKLQRPVPVVTIHGTADQFVLYDGGSGPAANALPGLDGGTVGSDGTADAMVPKTSIPENATQWAKRNGCTPRPKERSVAEDVTLITYPCPKDATVELYRVEGGGHAWPGSEFTKSIASVVGTTTFSINADDVIWEFFRTHPLTPTR